MDDPQILELAAQAAAGYTRTHPHEASTDDLLAEAWLAVARWRGKNPGSAITHAHALALMRSALYDLHRALSRSPALRTHAPPLAPPALPKKRARFRGSARGVGAG